MGVPAENERLQYDVTHFRDEDKVRLGLEVSLGQIAVSRTDNVPMVLEHNLYLGGIGPLKRLILGGPVSKLILRPHTERFGVWNVEGNGLKVKEPMLFEGFIDMVASGALEKVKKGLYEFDL
jgi:hypothetical protein